MKGGGKNSGKQAKKIIRQKGTGNLLPRSVPSDKTYAYKEPPESDD
jgi:hypothetical protein